MQPLVSVLIPAYRAAATIARAVSSVLAQNYTQWEIVIAADDNSDYAAILHNGGIAHDNIRIIRTGGIGTGVSCARNAALDAASGDIIAILDADDAFHPDKLARMAPFAQRHGLCCCAFNYVDYHGDDKHYIHTIGFGTAEGMLTADNYLNVHYSANAMLVFDRQKITARWLESLQVMEDITFAMTAFSYVQGVYHINEPLHEYIRSAGSLSTHLDAPARFMAAKQHILHRLENGTLGLSNAAAVAAYRRFIHISLEAEREFAQARQLDASITFSELLEKRLFDPER